MAQESRSRLLVLIAVVASIYFLRLARPVALPLAFALFLIALLWPVRLWFGRWLRPPLAFVATLLAFVACLWAFGWAISTSANAAIDRWPRYQTRFDEMAHTWGARAEAWGVSFGGGESKGTSLRAAMRSVFSFGEGALLTIALTVLGLLEVEPFRAKLTSLGSGAARFSIAGRQAATQFGRYFYTRTVMGAIQGVATGLFAWAVGLDLALVWGVLSALLNYIPTIGSVLAVVPPSLFALVQFPEPGKALLVVGGLAAVQLVLGNYVDPRIQGRWLSLSPFVVLLSVAFWGWLWGPAGALIAVPIALAIVIAGGQFPSMHAIAVLLASEGKDAEAVSSGSGPNK